MTSRARLDTHCTQCFTRTRIAEPTLESLVFSQDWYRSLLSLTLTFGAQTAATNMGITVIPHNCIAHPF